MSTDPKLESFLIPLAEIKSGTGNFSEENYIGGGGFGKVYKGKLAEFRTNDLAAIKRLDPSSFQGKHEFKTEVSMLYSYMHENIVSFIGYCDEENEMIIAYEYAHNQSLDKHLCDTNKMRCMTWKQRLGICVGAARGLNYLHWGLGPYHRIIHRDVKSSNILLDNNWEAKISDFGLSKFGPKDQPYTILNTRVAGTGGYIDPYYLANGILTKESDLYSFGVILFEMLCGRLVFPKKNKDKDDDDDDDDDSLTLMELVRRYKDNLNKIIDPHIRDQIHPRSLFVFKEIAMQCLKYDYTERPTMTMVLDKLEHALHFQEKHDLQKQEEDEHEKVIQKSDRRLAYNTKEELHSILSKGMFIDRGTKWFSLSTLNGKKSLIISAMELFKESIDSDFICWSSRPKSRFSKVAKFKDADFIYQRVHITTEMLSLETTYAVFIICTPELVSGQCRFGSEYMDSKPVDGVGCSYKYVDLRPAESRVSDDEWMEVELFHFTNHAKFASFEFIIQWLPLKVSFVKTLFNQGMAAAFRETLVSKGKELLGRGNYVQGIEFRPIDMNIEKEYEMGEFPELDFDDTDWEQKLPNDYQDILQRACDIENYTTTKEAYSLLTTGIFMDDYSMWFCLDKSTGKICYLLSPEKLIVGDCVKSCIREDMKSRFLSVLELECNGSLLVVGKINARMLSEKTYYAAWLVFKINTCNMNLVTYASLGMGEEKDEIRRVYLTQSSWMIQQPLNDQDSEHQDNERRLDRRPWERKDGWMEVELFPFFNHDIQGDCNVCVGVKVVGEIDMTIEGIEFRPKDIQS